MPLDDDTFAHLIDVRVHEPQRIAAAHAARARRATLTRDGMLFIVAADHTARGMVGLGSDPRAMANRRDMLRRLLVALEYPRVDGVLASAEILDDLVLLGALDDKVAVGTMNRGGLAGARWELDDRFTAYDTDRLLAANLDAGKMLLRIDDDDAGTAPTLEACARAVQALNDRKLLAMVEPIPYTRDAAGRAVWDDDPLKLLRAVGVSAALGGSSAYTWLKVQATADIAAVAAMTTQPVLLLGGAPGPDAAATFAAWEHGLEQPTVRGLVVGRALLYPADGDVAGAIGQAADLVARGREAEGWVMTLHRPAPSLADAADPVALTAADAGWAHCGLRVVALRAGETRTFATADTEMAALPLGGSLSVEVDGDRFDLAGRDDVFAAVTDWAYLPIEAEVRLSTTTGCEVALPSARATRRFEPAHIPAPAVPIEVRGAGPATRQVNGFCAPEAFVGADRLMCVELLTPDGNWSSYPPHKHDGTEGCPVNNEEIYYFRVGRAGASGYSSDGFAMHRTYTSDGDIDENVVVRDGDVFLIPRGYHGPCIAAPGYPLYYLNVLAGPGAERTMAFCDDPAHHWVRESWAGMAADPRCPMTTAAALQ